MRVTGDARFRAKGERTDGGPGRAEASLCKGDGQLGNPGIPMAGGCRIRYILRNCFCKIVPRAMDGPRASRASKSDGCSALLKRISYISQARSPSGDRLQPRPAIHTAIIMAVL